ncbi:High potential iron-sulfur protein [Natrialbaceae archaeon GCM10025810]|uniref:High potential iron-sulfur protein n=1 Tax=Halovalidus salilacus TaxID=3075124 RepID=UPI00360EFAC3
MADNPPKVPRRPILQTITTASVVGVTGCLGDADQEGESPSERAEGWCLEELSDEVPEEFETMESVDGRERDPDDIVTREEAGYVCRSENGQLCANCTFLITSNRSGFAAACTEVSGEIRTTDWCGLYQPAERLEE